MVFQERDICHCTTQRGPDDDDDDDDDCGCMITCSLQAQLASRALVGICAVSAMFPASHCQIPRLASMAQFSPQYTPYDPTDKSG